MNIRKQIILYSVPNIEKVSGGPRTRITKISEAVIKEAEGYSIIGNNLLKLKKTLIAPKSNICYVESATNRINIIDFFCLLFLKHKTNKMIIYIRDVYTITFPDEYKSFRKSITSFFFHLTNRYFGLIADIFAFPTEEMAIVYKNHFGYDRKSIALPPGTFKIKDDKSTPNISFLEKPSFLYLGGTGYRFSGFETFLNFASKNLEKFDFHILSPDDLESRLAEMGLTGKIHFTSVTHDRVFDYIVENKISFLFHPRPINSYDGITFPIKIMDSVSFKLPIISFKNEPMLSLLGNDYPFFIDNQEDILIFFHDKDELKRNYLISLKILEKTITENSYERQVQKICDTIEI